MVKGCDLLQRVQHPEGPVVRIRRETDELGVGQVLGSSYGLGHENVLQRDPGHAERVDEHGRHRLKRRHRVRQDHEVREVGEGDGEQLPGLSLGGLEAASAVVLAAQGEDRVVEAGPGLAPRRRVGLFLVGGGGLEGRAIQKRKPRMDSLEVH